MIKHTKIIRTSFHKIDIENEKVEKQDISGNPDVEEYIKSLISITTKKNHGRYFTYNNDGPSIRAFIEKMINNEPKFDEVSEAIADHLLEVEIKTQEKHSFTSLQKGSLIQCYLKRDDIPCYLVSKIGIEDFIQLKNLKKQKGFSFENKIYKSFFVTYNDIENESYSICVYDSQLKIAEFWSRNFLNLTVSFHDGENTIKLYNELISKMKSKYEKNFASDYIQLCNAIYTYFRTQDVFELEHFVTTIVTQYKPINSEFDKSDLEKNIRGLSYGTKFDSHFNIQADEIKRTYKYTLSVDPEVDIGFKTIIEKNEMKDKVFVVVKSGHKGLFIKSDAGYDKMLESGQLNLFEEDYE